MENCNRNREKSLSPPRIPNAFANNSPPTLQRKQKQKKFYFSTKSWKSKIVFFCEAKNINGMQSSIIKRYAGWKRYEYLVYWTLPLRKSRFNEPEIAEDFVLPEFFVNRILSCRFNTLFVLRPSAFYRLAWLRFWIFCKSLRIPNKRIMRFCASGNIGSLIAQWCILKANLLK